MDSVSESSTTKWNIFGKIVPKSEVVFLAQIVILYIVILVCIMNLSFKNGNTELWVSLLGYSLGCILPSPKISKLNNVLKTRATNNVVNRNSSENV